MLTASFDAVFLGQPEPQRPTPLKMLPPHNPPAIARSNATKTVAVDAGCSVSRFLMDDTLLVDDTAQVQLGRITRQEIVGSNMQRIVTTIGTYIVAPDMSVSRGKYERQSIHGHMVRIVNAI
eukprot:1847949-Prymnesium_polylepis.1